MNERTKFDYINLGEALDRLHEALSEPVDAKRYMIDATIQRFEFCIELFWKNFKNLAEKEGREILSPKQALAAAFQLKWINDEKIWLEMLHDRNLTSHTYKKVFADRIYQNIKVYYPELRIAYTKLADIVPH
jgi:nucleotidyltransferase substrate binding protein (TIGR01987 family)